VSRTRFPVVALAAVLAFVGSPSPAAALRLSRTAPADRPSAEPLRTVDLASVMSGGIAPPAWRDAASNLPQRCASNEAIGAAPCDDDLRCAWLAARAEAIEAFSAGDEVRRRRAAERLNRIADRLRAGRACGRDGPELERWESDRDAAARDAALAQLSLFSADDPAAGSVVLPATQQAEVDRIVALSHSRGLGAVPRESLTSLRGALRTAWTRRIWLSGQPALAALRRLTGERWAALGGVPDGCGEELVDPHLLADEWRGHLVRTAVPAAAVCLAGRFPREAERRGFEVADAQAAVSLARTIAGRAAGDPGGRSFGRDPEMKRAVDELARALSVRQKATRTAPTKSTTSRKAPPSEPAPRESTAVAAVVRPPRPPRDESGPRPKPPSPPRAATPRREPSRGAFPGGLVRLANRVVAKLGDDHGFRRDAARARTEEQRRKLVERMYVGLHRELCAPFEPMLPDDRSAALAALARLGVTPDERACSVTDEEKGLPRLLDAAGGLERLRAAASLRSAARFVGLGREDEALELLSRIPGDVRGATWAVVQAWALRRRGDHVAATRTLATLDGDLLHRLRASGDEEVARLVAHAWVSPQR